MTAVSWRVIEHGWSVRSSDGEDIGVVFLVVGDENEDIFDGLAITHHKGFAVHNYADRPHYVEASQVASIDDSGEVTLAITAEEAQQPAGARPAGQRRDRARGGIARRPDAHRDRAPDGRGSHELTPRRGPAGQGTSGRVSKYSASRAILLVAELDEDREREVEPLAAVAQASTRRTRWPAHGRRPR